ncbi:MAG: dihydrolipoamide acetyltransferase family protein [Deltaproteobacteria bacterium]|nr:dihydrolipoamide acetyltransferase family protein [Deltaproteobacteria bacterium]
MSFDFVLPDLGEGITEGEIRRWLVKEGDAVNEHQAILEVETDKAVVEVPSPKKGFVQKIRKLEGEIAKVGDVLLTIVEKLDVGEGLVPSQEKKSFGVVGRLPEAEDILATPAVRSLAKRLGVDIEKVKSTGLMGRITEEDVVKASGGGKDITKDQYGSVERVTIKGVRRSIAKNLLASMRTAAFVTGMDDADVSSLWRLREKEKKIALSKGIRLTFLPFLMKAVQHALKEHPMLNASVDEAGEEIVVKKYYNIGVAVDTTEGLMVPVVKDVDKKTILELAKELQELSEKAKERKIKLEELKGSTFTISNFGSFGGTYATPIINYPDVAILGTGKISDRPWVKDGQIAIRKIISLSLTFDHRVIDGAEAAQFLNKIIGYLEDPDSIFIESA